MRENKQKLLHYRRAILLHKTHTLQDLLGELLSVHKFVEDRWEDLGASGKRKRLINHHFSQLGMEFGNFLEFETGTNRLLMTVKNGVEAMDVATVAPPQTNPGLRNEFLDAILYYGVKGNHVVLLQSAGLQARQLQDYIN